MADGGIIPQSRNGNYHRAESNNKNQNEYPAVLFCVLDPSAIFSGVDMNANANRKPAFLSLLLFFWHKINFNFQF